MAVQFSDAFWKLSVGIKLKTYFLCGGVAFCVQMSFVNCDANFRDVSTWQLILPYFKMMTYFKIMNLKVNEKELDTLTDQKWEVWTQVRFFQLENWSACAKILYFEYWLPKRIQKY